MQVRAGARGCFQLLPVPHGICWLQSGEATPAQAHQVRGAAGKEMGDWSSCAGAEPQLGMGGYPGSVVRGFLFTREGTDCSWSCLPLSHPPVSPVPPARVPCLPGILVGQVRPWCPRWKGGSKIPLLGIRGS